MEPLSRILNQEQDKLVLELDDNVYNNNHFIFIDDIKVQAETEEKLCTISDIVVKVTKSMGFVINKDKSATNSNTYENATKRNTVTATNTRQN